MFVMPFKVFIVPSLRKIIRIRGCWIFMDSLIEQNRDSMRSGFRFRNLFCRTIYLSENWFTRKPVTAFRVGLYKTMVFSPVDDQRDTDD